MYTNKCLVSGSVCIALGISIALVWGILHQSLYDKSLKELVKHEIVVTSSDSAGYKGWYEDNSKNNPNYYVYYMWNITNLDDVKQGAVPTMELLGPYTYKYWFTNTNPNFFDDGNKVSYNLVEHYSFEPNMSTGDPYKDLVTNVNPPFVGFLAQTGQDSLMAVVATRPFLMQAINFLCTEYADLLSAQYVPPTLNVSYQNIITSLTPKMSLPQAQLYFYDTWANSTQPPNGVDPYWSAMLVSYMGTPSGISVASASKLFDIQTAYSLLANDSLSIITWHRATRNESSPEALLLLSTFALTAKQLHMVLIWRWKSYIPTYPQQRILSIANKYLPNANWTDVGWVQYTTAAYTPDSSFSDTYGEWYPEYSAGPFEMAASDFTDLTVLQTKYLFIGPNGIYNLDNFLDLLQIAGAMGDGSKWGMTSGQLMEFFGYLLSVALPYTYQDIQDLISDGYDLITTQTVDYWLFGCNDPILAYALGPEASFCGLIINGTSQATSTTWTGKDDIKKLNSYIAWREQTEISGVWNQTIPVMGVSDSGQFPPYLEDGDVIHVFDQDFVRSVPFNQVGKCSYKDMDCYTYVMDNVVFEASGLYTNTIPGFANETVVNQDVYIFLSNWDLYGVPAKYQNYSNMNPSESTFTTIMIEPTTGTALKADLRVMINIYLPPGSVSKWMQSYTSEYTEIPDDLFYPLFKAWQKSNIGDDDANELKKLLKLESHTAHVVALWSVVSFGIVLALAGAAMFWRGLNIKRREEYTLIQ